VTDNGRRFELVGMGDGWLETLDAGNRRGGWSSDVKEVTDRTTPFEAFNASFFSFI
jgi:hypothetical protein